MTDTEHSQEEGKKRAAESPESGSPEAPEKKRRKSSAKGKKGTQSPLPSEPVGIRYNQNEMRREKKSGLNIISWNVAGLRAVIKKDAGLLNQLVELENVDILCLQEHKLQEKHVAEVLPKLELDGWESSWSFSTEKAGYSGTAILYRKSSFEESEKIKLTEGIDKSEHDKEGRVVTMETSDMFIVNVYVPNAGGGLKRLNYRVQEWDVAFTQYLESLRKKKPVVVTGDLNCARDSIDIHNAKGNLKSAGFTPEERESFQKVYIDAGWVDTFREQHPGVHGYTYFGYRHNMRAKGKGWRLDYFLVSQDLSKACHDSFILQDFQGSDHCPIGLVIAK